MDESNVSSGCASNTVQLLVKGSRRILPNGNSFVAKARLDQTWYEFLEENGVQLAPGESAHVETSYVGGLIKPWGWSARLSEPIGDFVRKYKVQALKQHTVRLVRDDPNRRASERPRSSSALGSNAGPSTIGVKSERSTGQPSIVVNLGPSTPQRRQVWGAQDSYTLYQRPRYVPQSGGNEGKSRYKTRLSAAIRRARISLNNRITWESDLQSRAAVKREVDPEEAEVLVLGEQTGPVQFSEEDDRVIIESEPQLVDDYDESFDMDADDDNLDIDMIDTDSEDDGEILGELEIEGNSDGGMIQISQKNVPEQEENEEENNWALERHVKEDAEEDDNCSLITDVNDEEEELRQKGIEVTDVTTKAFRQLAKFDNTFLLSVKNEVKELRTTNYWSRNVRRAPLSSYLLQELFKE